MRFAAGRWSHQVDGWTLCLDVERVDRRVLGLLAAGMRVARLAPEDVCSIELPDEASPLPGVTIEHLDLGVRCPAGFRAVRTSLPLSLVVAEARRAA